ncbi:MAG: hypothetical protein MJZ41_02080 [Bacteroidaceae bacterium]|nr:hypothetical protein [Bacteroidaceae bacterium]
MNINELCPEFIVYGFLSDSNNKKARAQQHNEYVYTDDGIRLKTRHITVVTQSDKDMSSDSTEYIGNFTYEKGKMKMYNFGSGYIEPSTTGTSYQYRYYMKDHLGNNRVVSNLSGSIMQTNHYYPYGATLACSTNQSRQQYKYNGNLAQRSHRLSACSPSGDKLKNEGDNNLELDRTHGLNWYDYIARQYDPATGQFTSMDDFCEKYYHISPYVYCGGNPISRVDPDGRDRYRVLATGEYKYDKSMNSTNFSSKYGWDNYRYLGKNAETTNGRYLSLFGKNMDALEYQSRLYKHIENTFINYENAKKGKTEDESENFDIGKTFRNDLYSNYYNVYQMEYEGAEVRYTVLKSEKHNNMIGYVETFMKRDDGKNNLPPGIVIIIKPVRQGSEGSTIVRITFNDEKKAQLFLNKYNNEFKTNIHIAKYENYYK